MPDEYRVHFKEAEASWREDKWLLYFPSGGANSYETKAEAVKEGRRLAKNRKPSELVIEDKQGNFNRKHEYGFR